MLVEKPAGRFLAAVIIRPQDDPALRETIVTGAKRFALDRFCPRRTAESFAALYKAADKDLPLPADIPAEIPER